MLASRPSTVDSGPLLTKFSSQAQTSSYATDYGYVKQEMQKGRYFDIFECSRRMFHFSWKNVDLYFNKRTYGSPT